MENVHFPCTLLTLDLLRTFECTLVALLQWLPVLPALRFSREFGLVFCGFAFFLKNCGFLVFIKNCLFFGLVFCKFCCRLLFQIIWHFCCFNLQRNLAMFLYKFAHFGLVFRICLPGFIFNLPTGFMFFEFSYQTHVGLFFSVKLPILGLFFNFACLFLHNNLPSLVTSLHLFSDFLIALVQWPLCKQNGRFFRRVAYEGEKVETSFKSQNDVKYAFLHPWHELHPYYHFRKLAWVRVFYPPPPPETATNEGE